MVLSFILSQNIFPGTLRVKPEPSPWFLRQTGMPFWVLRMLTANLCVCRTECLPVCAYPPKLGSSRLGNSVVMEALGTLVLAGS